jgi:acyl-[acyl carrier protein]--UDP-N-acetylglucosamine O-acyltransferase
MRRTLISLLIALSVSGAALAQDDVSKVNGTAEVAAGQHVGNVSTVNGSVRIGDKAVVQKASTVNGAVELGSGATATIVKTVNGSLTLHDGAQVSQEVSNVNGRVKLERGADVKGHLSNVNGEVSLDGAHVGGGIETVNADVTIGENSKVEGGLLVKKPKMNWFGSNEDRKPKIVIGPHAVVQGNLTFERDVDLYVSDSATVGKIEGATAKKFAGSAP